jgi:ribonuclease BN (tRNA processing enzyme)
MLDHDILVDAGTGVGDLTVEQMLRIDTVFLTHSHLDHTALLPMLADRVGPRRDRSLIVYALPETIAILKRDVFNFRLWPDYTALPTLANPYVVFRAVTVGCTVEISGRRVTPLPVQHAVPAVAYQLESPKASFVFSGDTTYYPPFWDALSAIHNLRYLMIEVTFLDRNTAGAKAAGHMRPKLLALGLKHLDRSIRLLITHMVPGNEDATMAEIRKAAEGFKAERAERGQVFEF